MAEANGSRTHLQRKNTPHTGFEDRAPHRQSIASKRIVACLDLARRKDVGLFGGPGRVRTVDLFHAMEARSQLRHRPTRQGVQFENSIFTNDLRVAFELPSTPVFLYASTSKLVANVIIRFNAIAY